MHIPLKHKGKYITGHTAISRSLSNRSTSTLQSISDIGESDDEHSILLEEEASSPAAPTEYFSTSEPVPIEVVSSELQAALELISPLGNVREKESSLATRIDTSLKTIASSSSLKYNTPLLVLYASTFVSHMTSTIIKGIADIVEMSPTKTQASLDDLHEYMSSDDRVSILWKNLVSSTQY